MNESTLSVLYEIASLKNGWLSKMMELGFSNQDVAYLEWLDDQQSDGGKNVKLLEKEVEREGGPDVYFLETEEEKWNAANKKIAEINRAYDDAHRRDRPLLEKQCLLLASEYERLKHLRNKIRARMIHTQYPESTQLSEREIMIAREFPLERLVELNRQKMMLCPFHPDKTPSFYVKNGFGYCWSCAASCDAIRYQMDVHGMKFIDAVKSLQ